MSVLKIRLTWGTSSWCGSAGLVSQTQPGRTSLWARVVVVARRGGTVDATRRERLRAMLPRDGAVVGIDLAEDKQAIAVVGHDVRVLARKTVRVKAFRLGEALDWALAKAREK